MLFAANVLILFGVLVLLGGVSVQQWSAALHASSPSMRRTSLASACVTTFCGFVVLFVIALDVIRIIR